MAEKYNVNQRIRGGAFDDRLNPHFGKTAPGIGDLGAAHLPNPMVKSTDLQAIPEQDARRHGRIGLPSRFKR